MCKGSEPAVRHHSFLLIVLLSTISTSVLAEPAGKVLFAAGEVAAVDQAGNRRVVHKGTAIEEGDTLLTGSGRVQVRFKDGGFIALQPQSQFKVERYQYTAAGDHEDGVVMSLIKGGLRTISGLVGKQDRHAYEMKAAIATIGIRGTEYALELDGALVGHVTHGAIEVCNGAGCLGVQSGQAFSVPSLTDAPVLAERRAFLPPSEPNAQSRTDDQGEQQERTAVAESSDRDEPVSDDTDAARDDGQSTAAQDDSAPGGQAPASQETEAAPGRSPAIAGTGGEDSAAGASAAGSAGHAGIDLGVEAIAPLRKSTMAADVASGDADTHASVVAPAAATALSLPAPGENDVVRTRSARHGADGLAPRQVRRSTAGQQINFRLQDLDRASVGQGRADRTTGEMVPRHIQKPVGVLRNEFRLPGPGGATPGHARPEYGRDSVARVLASEPKSTFATAAPPGTSPGPGSDPDGDVVTTGAFRERIVESRPRIEPQRFDRTRFRAFEFPRRDGPIWRGHVRR